jgi:signal transduction histidine kinase
LILKRAHQRAEIRTVMTATLEEPRVEAATDTPVPERAPRFDVFDVLSLALAVIAMGLAFSFAAGVVPADQVETFGRLASASVLGLSSIIISRSLVRLDADAMRGWSILASGIASLAVAGFVLAVLGNDPFPAYADPFLGLFVVATAIGVWRLPHYGGSVNTRLRVVLDTLAGTVAVGALAAEVVSSVENVDASTLARPVLGLLLVGALLVATVRRSPYRYDRRLVALVVGGGLVAAGLLFEPWLETRTETAMGMVMASAGTFAFLAWAIRQPVARSASQVGRTALWKLIVPYSLVGVLFAVFFYRAVTEEASLTGFLPWGVLIILALFAVRQVVATRENRELIEMERDQLIASVSHELRTPLTAVTGFADVIWDQWGNLTQQDARDMMDIIRTQSHHLSGIITDIVALVRDELESVRLEPERIDARELIGEAIKSVFDFNAGNLPVSAQVEPYTELIGDRARLHQVLVAMFKNAQRYGKGRILVVARRTKDGRVIEVHDDGEGLPARHETVVWDRFQRGSHQLNSNVPGSGLGLTVIRSIAKAHGGKAHYRRSEKLGGACFSVELPYEKVRDQVDSAS